MLSEIGIMLTSRSSTLPGLSLMSPLGPSRFNSALVLSAASTTASRESSSGWDALAAAALSFFDDAGRV